MHIHSLREELDASLHKITEVFKSFKPQLLEKSQRQTVELTFETLSEDELIFGKQLKEENESIRQVYFLTSLYTRMDRKNKK